MSNEPSFLIGNSPTFSIDPEDIKACPKLFANFVQVTTTVEEAHLIFGIRMNSLIPGDSSAIIPQAAVSLSIAHAKRLLVALKNNLAKHEAALAELKKAQEAAGGEPHA